MRPNYFNEAQSFLRS